MPLNGPGMEKLYAAFRPARPSDDCAVDPEYGGGIAYFHAKEQEFTGRHRLRAPEPAAIDGQIENGPGRGSGDPGQSGGKQNRNPRLLAAIILEAIQRHGPGVTEYHHVQMD